MKPLVVAVPIVLATYVGACVFGAAATMEIPRIPLSSRPSSVGLVYEDVSFASRDHAVQLKGWYLPARGDTALIIINGGFQNRVDNVVDTLDLSRDLIQKGYSILLFDQRGRGESEGEGHPLSNISNDIGGALDYLKSRGYPAARIGIIGYCSGAASACIFASQENIGGLVLDGCFASVSGMVVTQATQRGIPALMVNVFMQGILLSVKAMYHYTLVDPIDVVSKISCPLLFIHEEYDDFVSLDETQQLFESSRNSAKELWQLPGAGHSQAYQTHPAEYVERLDEFFTAAIK
jgi:pimeloyl-ACP methyl ester carboxylesterase